MYKELINKLSEPTKECIKNAYSIALAKMSNDEYEYVFQKIFKKITILEGSQIQWVRNLAVYYRMLYEILENHRKKEQRLTEEAYQKILAALFYYINPFDFIFDFTPDMGYIDDLYVLILCLESLSEDDKKIIMKDYEKIFEVTV
ncbi:MAG: DUF1232 domain-containing protein [Elusimicrobia bacterium]|nr:DUF1232 domain-containing protein [Elusimicrobiota bacterium]MBD3412416.1 DUF1232 domain-containing protein [Elusimicrobiota bacterium]